jgi:hypothetical protein
VPALVLTAIVPSTQRHARHAILSYVYTCATSRPRSRSHTRTVLSRDALIALPAPPHHTPGSPSARSSLTCVETETILTISVS